MSGLYFIKDHGRSCRRRSELEVKSSRHSFLGEHRRDAIAAPPASSNGAGRRPLAHGERTGRRRLLRLSRPTALPFERLAAARRQAAPQAASRGYAPRARSRARTTPARSVPDRRRHRQARGRRSTARTASSCARRFPPACRDTRRRWASSPSSRKPGGIDRTSTAARRCPICSGSPGPASRCTPDRGPAIRPRTAASACRRISPSGCFTRPRSARG